MTFSFDKYIKEQEAKSEKVTEVDKEIVDEIMMITESLSKVPDSANRQCLFRYYWKGYGQEVLMTDLQVNRLLGYFKSKNITCEIVKDVDFKEQENYIKFTGKTFPQLLEEFKSKGVEKDINAYLEKEKNSAYRPNQ